MGTATRAHSRIPICNLSAAIILGILPGISMPPDIIKDIRITYRQPWRLYTDYPFLVILWAYYELSNAPNEPKNLLGLLLNR